MEKKQKDPIAQAMARKRWDKLDEEQRRKETDAAREERWKGHEPKGKKKPRKAKPEVK